MTDWVGSAFVLLGAVFLFSAGLGLLRMPDPLTRMQAGTKATTLGATLALVGIAILNPGWTPKLALFVLFVFASNPLSAHALARAAARRGAPMMRGTRVEDAPPTAANEPRR